MQTVECFPQHEIFFKIVCVQRQCTCCTINSSCHVSFKFPFCLLRPIRDRRGGGGGDEMKKAKKKSNDLV